MRPPLEPPKTTAQGSRAPSDLEALLRNLPFRAGEGDVRSILEEVATATYSHFRHSEVTLDEVLDVSRVSGYLALEQRFGRISKASNPEHAAQLLVGALAAHAFAGDGESSPTAGGAPETYAREAVRILLDGIAERE